MGAEARERKTVFTFELDAKRQQALAALVASGNFRPAKTPYSLLSVQGDGFSATLYEKERHGLRKLCVQGAKAQDFVEFSLEPLVLGEARLGYEKILSPEEHGPRAGGDESGKGDYFGPLAVCCAYADGALEDEMARMGVRDCKRMTDAAVLEAGAALRSLLGPSGYAVVKIGPAAYNRLYAKMKNVNRMLAWAHAAAVEELLEKRPDCPRVVIDQFAKTEDVMRRAMKERGRRATLVQRHRAESDMAVAAASVIARETFLRAVAEQAKASGLERLPIGSSDPRVRETAARMVRERGPNWIMNNCKAHFQTTDKVLADCGLDRSALPPEGRIASAFFRKSQTEEK